jgi:hypothetical protein
MVNRNGLEQACFDHPLIEDKNRRGEPTASRILTAALSSRASCGSAQS